MFHVNPLHLQPPWQGKQVWASIKYKLKISLFTSLKQCLVFSTYIICNARRGGNDTICCPTIWCCSGKVGGTTRWCFVAPTMREGETLILIELLYIWPNLNTKWYHRHQISLLRCQQPMKDKLHCIPMVGGGNWKPKPGFLWHWDIVNGPCVVVGSMQFGRWSTKAHPTAYGDPTWHKQWGPVATETIARNLSIATYHLEYNPPSIYVHTSKQGNL